MDPATILALVEAGLKVVNVVVADVKAGKTVLSTDQAAQLKSMLDAQHAANLEASAALDAMLDEAANK